MAEYDNPKLKDPWRELAVRLERRASEYEDVGLLWIVKRIGMTSWRVFQTRTMRDSWLVAWKKSPKSFTIGPTHAHLCGWVKSTLITAGGRSFKGGYSDLRFYVEGSNCGKCP